MKEDFSDFYTIIYKKYLAIAADLSLRSSKRQFAIFLEHDNDGKVRSWEKGQWPGTDDCWTLHKKLGCRLEWLLTGKGEPWPEEDRAALVKSVAHDTRVQAVAGAVDAVAGSLSRPGDDDPRVREAERQIEELRRQVEDLRTTISTQNELIAIYRERSAATSFSERHTSKGASARTSAGAAPSLPKTR